MTDINEENKDLIENTTPFGLLDKETQERMSAWPHGWQAWKGTSFGWTNVAGSTSNNLIIFGNYELAYRAKPAPDPEPVEVRHEVSITVESPLLPKEMHYKLSFDKKLENPTIEAIE